MDLKFRNGAQTCQMMISKNPSHSITPGLTGTAPTTSCTCLVLKSHLSATWELGLRIRGKMFISSVKARYSTNDNHYDNNEIYHHFAQYSSSSNKHGSILHSSNTIVYMRIFIPHILSGNLEPSTQHDTMHLEVLHKRSHHIQHQPNIWFRSL